LFVLFSLRGILDYRKKQEGIIELYHIEQCVDPDCHWSYRLYSSDFFLTSRNPYGTVNSSATIRTGISNSLINRKDGSIEDVNEAEMIVLRDHSPFSTIVDRFRRQIMSSVSVKKVKPDDRVDVEGHPGIKHPNHTTKDVTNNSSIVNLRNRENVKVSQIKTAITQKAISKKKRRQKQNETNKSANAIHVSSQSASVKLTRVNNLLTKPSILHSSQSINNQNREPAEIIKKTNVTVISVPSAYRQTDKNDLSRKNIHDLSASSVNVERVQKKKNTNLETDSALPVSTG
jgi:hypothetical protein